MKGGNEPPIETSGLAASGIWVRRLRPVPSLIDEALCLAQVLQIWQLDQEMSIERMGGVCAEISSPSLQPVWVYLIEVAGTRLDEGALFGNHPLGYVLPGEAVRIVALVQPARSLVLGALVETPTRRRMLWLTSSPSLR